MFQIQLLLGEQLERRLNQEDIISNCLISRNKNGKLSGSIPTETGVFRVPQSPDIRRIGE